MAVMHASFEHHMADNALLYGALHDSLVHNIVYGWLFHSNYISDICKNQRWRMECLQKIQPVSSSPQPAKKDISQNWQIWISSKEEFWEEGNKSFDALPVYCVL